MIRQQIVNYLKTNLATVLNMPAYDWLGFGANPSQAPFVDIHDTEDNVVLEAMSGPYTHELLVEIILVADGATTAANLRSYVDTVVQFLTANKSLGGICMQGLLTRVAVDVMVETERVGTATVEYKFLFLE